MPPTFPTSSYWLKREGTGVGAPYRPPVCHHDFTLLPDEPAPVARRLQVAFSGLFGNQNAVALRAGTIVSLAFESHEGVRNLTLQSASYDAASLGGGVGDSVLTLPMGAAGTVDTLFTLPLSVTDGVVAQAVWSANTHLDVVVDTAGSLALALRFSLISASNVVVSVDKTYAQLGPVLDAAFQVQNQIRCHIPLATLLHWLNDAVLVHGAASSPYKLQVSLVREGRRISHRFTYVYVPDAIDVQLLETHGARKLLFKGGNMQGFDPLGAVAAAFADDDAIAAVVADPPAGDLPFSAGENPLYLTAAERKTIKAMLAARGLAGKLAAAQQRLDGLAHSPLPREVVSRLRLDNTNQVANYRALTTAVEEVRATGANIDDHDARASLATRGDYDQNTMNILVEREGGWFVHLGWGVTLIARRDADTGRYYLSRLYIAGYLSGPGRTLSVLDRQGNFAAFRGTGDELPVFEEGAEVPTAVRRAGSVRPTTVDIAGRFRALGVDAHRSCPWTVFDFPEMAYPLASAITYGVSACSASTTFDDADHPEVLIFCHLDGNVYPPYVSTLGWVRAADNPHGAVAATAFRSINFMIAELEEVDKYSPAVLFPDGLGELTSYDSVFCPRESHLWGFTAGQIPRGYDATGVDFAADGTRPDLVGVYGQRSFAPTALINHGERAIAGVRPAREALFDAQRSVYATLPTVMGSFDTANIGAFQTFLRTAHEQVQTQASMRDAEAGTPFYRLRAEVVGQRTVFRLRNVGRGLFNAMATHASCKTLTTADFVVMSDGVLGWIEHR